MMTNTVFRHSGPGCFNINKMRISGVMIVNRNGEAIEVDSWQQMVFGPICSFQWMRYRAGDPIPEGAVVGGHLSGGRNSTPRCHDTFNN